MHVPVEVADKAVEFVKDKGIDCCLALGGSTIGLAKIIALKTHLPIVAIPTTGGAFNLPHAQVHAITLAYSVHYNRNADNEAMDKLAEALGVEDREKVGLAIYHLNESLGIKMTLKDLGLPKQGPAEVARIVCASPYYNPRDYNYKELSDLLEKAYKDLPPI